ncbi:short-chain dehydrogenase/reductase (SDR) family protein [Tieghemostelium lacteum]|uniref:Short-chain dehydrogenase/reductase (SDR) family protein n=1 Tax=Tieghemostelium lacteum TaxID=361077 RepID=A0A152A985_TIELA|nr:short-chain dehydrogenase/reductase (SDR) family protein [Tieghemostelium lacteum]|eukprot:KYR02691.1 short-chain dehydrogenase/reductase (SDR) family protein [Tieghemostelium lacteum]
MDNLNNKVCIITGSNISIGLETAKLIAKENYTVILACRDLKKAENAAQEIKQQTGNNNIQCLKLDLTSLQSVRDFVEEFKKLNLPLNLLVNNAGIMMVPYSKTIDGFGIQFQVNHLGPFLLTYLLLDKLNESRGSRILNLSSRAHYHAAKVNLENLDVSEKDYARIENYGFTKLCAILLTKELQRRVEEKGSDIIVNSIHPGVVHTNLASHLGAVVRFFNSILAPLFYTSLKESAEACAKLAMGNKDDTKDIKASYFNVSNIATPSKQAMDPELAKSLWIKTAELLKLDPSTPIN